MQKGGSSALNHLRGRQRRTSQGQCRCGQRLLAQVSHFDMADSKDRFGSEVCFLASATASLVQRCRCMSVAIALGVASLGLKTSAHFVSRQSGFFLAVKSLITENFADLFWLKEPKKICFFMFFSCCFFSCNSHLLLPILAFHHNQPPSEHLFLERDITTHVSAHAVHVSAHTILDAQLKLLAEAIVHGIFSSHAAT